jgi:hypothetical protein
MMLFKLPAALDPSGKLVERESGEKGVRYSCPGCGAAVTFRAGEILAPHFAHHPDVACSPELVRRKIFDLSHPGGKEAPEDMPELVRRKIFDLSHPGGKEAPEDMPEAPEDPARVAEYEKALLALCRPKPMTPQERAQFKADRKISESTESTPIVPKTSQGELF